MREYTEKEIQEIRETYNSDELEHGCGYWSVCLDHECFCSMDAPSVKGSTSKCGIACTRICVRSSANCRRSANNWIWR